MITPLRETEPSPAADSTEATLVNATWLSEHQSLGLSATAGRWFELPTFGHSHVIVRRRAYEIAAKSYEIHLGLIW